MCGLSPLILQLFFVLFYNWLMQRAIISEFLENHHFAGSVGVGELTDIILADMRSGLRGEKAGQNMFRTWMLPPDDRPKNQSVIVIDAGGTNFRSCLAAFDGEGNCSVSNFRNTVMPGVERELSRDEFFSAVADSIEYLRDASDRIGFCFSYAMDMTRDGDGIPTVFGKEIKAPGVLGCPVGENLRRELGRRGWRRIERISLLNDTVAALLAGCATKRSGAEFSSYIGFILGTGINAAYIQPETDGIERQIIVCESGRCRGLPSSDFDAALDKKTVCPGQYPLEKQSSGAYLGGIAREMLLCAASDGILSSSACAAVPSLGSLSLVDVDSFLHGPFNDGKISRLCADDTDRETVYRLFSCVVERCAKNAAAILCATAVQSGAGTSVLRPICILCNGTTFFKTRGLKERIRQFLSQELTARRGIHFELASAENDIALGSAIAGLRR